MCLQIEHLVLSCRQLNTQFIIDDDLNDKIQAKIQKQGGPELNVSRGPRDNEFDDDDNNLSNELIKKSGGVNSKKQALDKKQLPPTDKKN